jgi:tetrapyrrole methylase family protein/MazG family protein
MTKTIYRKEIWEAFKMKESAFDLWISNNGRHTKCSGDSFISNRSDVIDRNYPLLIVNISSDIMDNVKNKLLKYYDSMCDVRIINTDNTTTLTTLKDAKEFTDICISGSDFIKRNHFGFNDLIEIMRRLRDPDGCPWDKVQTHESIRQNALEEAYELAEAIDLNDSVKMCEESGDVLLQAIFHALIAESLNEFTIEDMINTLSMKLISRHTHIFGANKANTADEALMFWEKAKTEEKQTRTIADKINSIPITLPALQRAEKIIKILKKDKQIDITALINDTRSSIKNMELANEIQDAKDSFGHKLLVLLKMAVDSEIDLEKELAIATNRIVCQAQEIKHKLDIIIKKPGTKDNERS